MDHSGLEASPGLSDMPNDEFCDGINISDVIEAIESADPEGVTMEPTSAPEKPYVRIVEQPASRAMRFRYECEGRSAGSIPGATSTPENKTYPTIELLNYTGRAVVVVSCVTKDSPYRPHPHNLVGRENCDRGVCTVIKKAETNSVSFPNLGIRCVKKRDIEEALRKREEIQVDPYQTGFAHRSQQSSIDLNAVRLCFQVFLEGTRGKFNVPVQPVVSEPIYDKKAMSELVICKLSDCTAPVSGQKDMILLCEKVAKEDIQVRFYEQDGTWEGFGEFQPAQVHKQVAIAFRTPKYHNQEITENVKVFIQLRRISDGETSESWPFEFTPSEPVRKRKTPRPNELLHSLQRQAISRNKQPDQFNILPDSVIKIEPPESSPGHMKYNRSPAHSPNTQFTQQPITLGQFSPPQQLPQRCVTQNSVNNVFMSGASVIDNANKHEDFSTLTGKQNMQQGAWNVPTSLKSETVRMTNNYPVMYTPIIQDQNMPSTSAAFNNVLFSNLDQNISNDLDVAFKTNNNMISFNTDYNPELFGIPNISNTYEPSTNPILRNDEVQMGSNSLYNLDSKELVPFSPDLMETLNNEDNLSENLSNILCISRNSCDNSDNTDNITAKTMNAIRDLNDLLKK